MFDIDVKEDVFAAILVEQNKKLIIDKIDLPKHLKVGQVLASWEPYHGFPRLKPPSNPVRATPRTSWTGWGVVTN